MSRARKREMARADLKATCMLLITAVEHGLDLAQPLEKLFRLAELVLAPDARRDWLRRRLGFADGSGLALLRQQRSGAAAAVDAIERRIDGAAA